MHCMKVASLSYQLFAEVYLPLKTQHRKHEHRGSRTWIFFEVIKCKVFHFRPAIIIPFQFYNLGNVQDFVFLCVCVWIWICVCVCMWISFFFVCVCVFVFLHRFARCVAYCLGPIIHRGLWHGQFRCWRSELDHLDLAMFVRRVLPVIPLEGHLKVTNARHLRLKKLSNLVFI